MGTHYRIWLFVPVENIGVALAELEKIVDKTYTHPMEITLPDGETIQVSDLRNYPPHNTILKPDDYLSWVSYTVSLYFPIDEIVQNYMRKEDESLKEMSNYTLSENQVVVINNEKYFPHGGIVVMLQCGRKYCKISVGSVAKSQNILIRGSTGFHKMMQRILKSADGVAGLINIGEYEYFLLENPNLTIKLDEDSDLGEIDRLVDDIVIKVEKVKSNLI